MAEEKEEKVEQEEVEENVEETSAEDVKTEKEDESQQKEATVPYDRFQQVIEEKNEYKNKLENLQKDLEEMEDPEKIKEKYKEQLEEVKQKTIKSKKEYALKTKALEEGVRKEALDDIVKVADLDKLKYNEENEEIIGVDDLVNNLKENKSFFFEKNEEEASKAGNDFKGNDLDKDEQRQLKKFFGINNK